LGVKQDGTSKYKNSNRYSTSTAETKDTDPLKKEERIGGQG